MPVPKTFWEWMYKRHHSYMPGLENLTPEQCTIAAEIMTETFSGNGPFSQIIREGELFTNLDLLSEIMRRQGRPLKDSVD